MNSSSHFPSSFFAEIFLIALLVLLSIVFHFNGLYGQDAHEYLRISRELPAVIFHGKEMAHTIFPVMYPLLGFLFAEIVRNDFISMQLVAILSFVVAFHFLKKLLSILYQKDEAANNYVLIFFAFSPYVMRFGLLSMSDMLCMMFLVIASFNTTTFYYTTRNFNAVLAILFCMCAMATRYAVAVIAVPLIVFITWNLVRRRAWKVLLVCIAAAIIPLLPDLLLRNRLLFFQFSKGKAFVDYGSDAYSWSPINFFRKDFLNADGWQHYPQWNIFYSVFNLAHPAFLFAGVFLLLFLKKKDFQSSIAILFAVIVLLYACYLAGLRYQSTRYLLQSFPFVIALLFPSYIRIKKRFFGVGKLNSIVNAGVIAIQLILFFISSRTIYVLNQTEKNIAASLQSYPNETVYTCSIVPALQSYRVSNPVVDLYFVKIDTVKQPSLLLFNEEEFKNHFSGMKPMENFNVIQSHYHISVLKEFSSGWKLYSVD